VTAPPPGGASQELVSTSIGNGMGMPADMAPTSVVWDHTVVVDNNIALVFGHVVDQAIAIRTTDRGRTWTALKTKAGKWQSWGTSSDGSTVLASGGRKKQNVAPGKFAPIIDSKLWFAPDDSALGEAAPFFPNEEALKGVEISSGVARPAVLKSDLASIIADKGRQPLIVYGAPGGSKQPDAVIPPRGRWVRAPYGRPANLLSVAGASLELRPWPLPGDPIDPGSKVPGLILARGMAEQLDAGPDCESGAWSFARLSSTPNNVHLVGISDTRALAFKLPNGADERIGCTTKAVVVEIMDKANDAGPPQPQLIRCSLDDAKCAAPKSHPFQIWPQKHDRKILAVPTKQGVVATMTAHTGNRYGAYLATSMDGGKTFELPRVIGETETGRGYFAIGALVAFDDRVVMLISADVTGTRGRRWYAMASDDGGENWGPP
jgi:hypothetical protein